MPRSRKAVKRNKGTVVKQKVKKSTAVKEAVVGKLWKRKDTVRTNYASMGLAAVVNDDSAVAVNVNSRTGTIDASAVSSLALGTGQLQVAAAVPLHQREDVQVTSSEIKEQAIKDLEEAASFAAPPRLFMFEGDQEFVERLIEKYGDDCVKMARDKRLNPYQHTPAQIRRKLDKYKHLMEDLRERGIQDHTTRRSTATELPCHTWNVFPKQAV